MTGAPQTIDLPTKYKWYDPNHNQVTQLQIPDLTGTYVTGVGTTAALPQPRISPRYASAVTSPLVVTITTDAPGDTIYYTLDGSIPRPSTGGTAVYTGPLHLANSVVVKARSFQSGTT